MKKWLLVISLVIVSAFLIYSSFNEEEKKVTKVSPSQSLGELIEKEQTPVEPPLSEIPYFSLAEGMTYKLSSEIEMFGEEVEVIKQQGNAFLVQGQYGNTLHFYRLYLIDQEGINIFYEVTEDENDYQKTASFIEKKDYDSVFNLASNQEFFILKSPYSVGNEWGYGKIIEASEKKLIVEYENGNKTTFEKPFGITEMEFVLPKEMQEHYNEASFSAFRVEG